MSHPCSHAGTFIVTQLASVRCAILAPDPDPPEVGSVLCASQLQGPVSERLNEGHQQHAADPWTALSRVWLDRLVREPTAFTSWTKLLTSPFEVQTEDAMAYGAPLSRRRPRNIAVGIAYVAFGVIMGTAVAFGVRGGSHLDSACAT